MSTLEKVLEDASRLPYDQQEMLIGILQQRFRESRRAEIAADARESINEFYAGKTHPSSSTEVISDLRSFLDETDS